MVVASIDWTVRMPYTNGNEVLSQQRKTSRGVIRTFGDESNRKTKIENESLSGTESAITRRT
jgi:hypothetical protein